MANTFSLISTISFVAAFVFLLLAVIFWVLFRIPTVIGDLTGKTAKKSIAKMRAANEKTGSKPYRESKGNAGRVKLTAPIPTEERMGQKKGKKAKTAPHGRSAAPSSAGEAIPQTGLLNDANSCVGNAAVMPETGVLSENKANARKSEETGLLDDEATGLLRDPAATAPLTAQLPHAPQRTGGKKLTMLEEVMLIHTEEEIP
jgi:hypothetical protein